jgi:colicin import membrane protein
MKRLSFLAVALLAVGCSSADSAPEAGAAPPPSAPATKESQIANLRAQIQSKRADAAQADADLARIAAEREQLAGQGASEQKTNRLVELGRLESETKQKKSSISSDIASLEKQLSEVSGTARAKTDDEALEAALAAEAAREKEVAERKKASEDAARTEEARKIAAAESARQAELEARAKEKVQGGRAAAAGDESTFEERWADVIMKVRVELQKYKRW